MSEAPARIASPIRNLYRIATLACSSLLISPSFAQAPAAAPTPAPEKPLPSLDLSSMDLSADPCTDMYKFACGHFDANHPIPPDQPAVDPFYVLYNVNTQELNTILQKAETGGATRSPDEQKIGDYFNACMDTSLDPVRRPHPHPAYVGRDRRSRWKSRRSRQTRRPARRVAAPRCQRLLRIRRAAGLQGCLQTNCRNRAGRPRPA